MFIDKNLCDIIYLNLDVNQEKIVEEGGLDALLMLLRSSHNTTILRVASGAVANLAMNGIHVSVFLTSIYYRDTLNNLNMVHYYCPSIWPWYADLLTL